MKAQKVDEIANSVPEDIKSAGKLVVGVNIPYSITAVTAALLQGANGSNKDIRDYSYASATATLYTIAQIADE